MSGKLAVALLVLFCVGQVYPASIPKSVPVSLNKNLTKNAIKDIIHQLNILISRIGQGIAELKNLMVDLERRVTEAIADLDFFQILDDLDNQTKNILQEAGVTEDEAADCIDKIREPSKNLFESVIIGHSECSKPIRPAMEHLQQQISELSPQAADTISFISNGVTQCLSEQNPEQQLQCLKDLEKQANSLTNDLTGRIGEAIGENRKIINELVDELTLCVQAVDVNNQQQAIINSLRKCVSDLVSTTTN